MREAIFPVLPENKRLTISMYSNGTVPTLEKWEDKNVTPEKLFLFDLDDTLFDSEYCHRFGLTGLQDTYRQLANIPLDELYAEYERQLNATYDSVLEGRVSLADSRIERFRRLFLNFKVDVQPSELAGVVKLYRDGYERSRRPVPGSIALLSYLKLRGRVGVLTNGLLKTQSEKIAICGMERLVDFVLTSEEIGAKKPDKAIFLAALAKVGAAPQQAVYIGDSWGSDIVGAFGAGIRAVWFNRRQQVCPNQTVATELRTYEPLEIAVRAINPEPQLEADDCGPSTSSRWSGAILTQKNSRKTV